MPNANDCCYAILNFHSIDRSVAIEYATVKTVSFNPTHVKRRGKLLLRLKMNKRMILLYCQNSRRASTNSDQKHFENTSKEKKNEKNRNLERKKNFKRIKWNWYWYSVRNKKQIKPTFDYRTGFDKDKIYTEHKVGPNHTFAFNYLYANVSKVLFFFHSAKLSRWTCPTGSHSPP